MKVETSNYLHHIEACTDLSSTGVRITIPYANFNETIQYDLGNKTEKNILAIEIKQLSDIGHNGESPCFLKVSFTGSAGTNNLTELKCYWITDTGSQKATNTPH